MFKSKTVKTESKYDKVSQVWKSRRFLRTLKISPDLITDACIPFLDSRGLLVCFLYTFSLGQLQILRQSPSDQRPGLQHGLELARCFNRFRPGNNCIKPIHQQHSSSKVLLSSRFVHLHGQVFPWKAWHAGRSIDFSGFNQFC